VEARTAHEVLSEETRRLERALHDHDTDVHGPTRRAYAESDGLPGVHAVHDELHAAGHRQSDLLEAQARARRNAFVLEVDAQVDELVAIARRVDAIRRRRLPDGPGVSAYWHGLLVELGQVADRLSESWPGAAAEAGAHAVSVATRS
jgi:hypothetical protein